MSASPRQPRPLSLPPRAASRRARLSFIFILHPSSFILVFLLGGSGLGAAWQTPAPPAPFVLPNGMRVVARERHANPLVAIDLWVRAGAREETADEVGSAHFLEHTLFKGTRTRGPGETDIAIENLGAILDAATGPDAAHYFTTVATAHLPQALDILADVVRNATLLEPEIERERGVILDELAEHDSDPTAHLVDLLYADALPHHPYHRSPGGTQATIRARGRDTLVAFYRRLYTPERCTLAFAGDITPEKAQEEARRAFGDWTPGGGRGVPAPTPANFAGLPDPDSAEPLAPRRFEVTQEKSDGLVGLAFRAPAARDARMACAALVTVELLGDSPSRGRLAALAPDAEAAARYSPRLDPSLFLLTAALPSRAASSEISARLAQIENALRAAILHLQTSPPTRTEIAAAKQRVLGQEQFRLETNAGLARAIAQADITGGDTPEMFRARVRRLTASDIQQFLARYLDPAHAVAVRILPATGGAP